MNQPNRKLFLLFSKLTLIFSLLVIAAGSLVKATGAGMGCPDWPKCYGYWVPPMNEEQVLFKAHKEFKKGQIIVHNNALWVAKTDFSTPSLFNASQWEKYKKHDYAVYKAEHTIIEYINRLCGAVLGIMAIFMLWFSFPFRKQNSLVFWGSLFSFVVICVEGYLGALVVSSNLKPLKISIHLYFAFLILIAVTYTQSKESEKIEVETAKYKLIRRLLVLSVILLLVQLFLGSNVREAFDYLRLSSEDRVFWVEKSNWIFLSHRTFTWLYAVVTITALVLLYKAKVKHASINATLILLLLNTLSGIVMGYFAVPKAMQPTHLMLASLLLTSSCILLFTLKKQNKSIV